MSLRGVRERRRWRFDAFLGCDFQRSFERQLDLAGRFFARVAMRHDTGPFDDLGNEAFVTFFRRLPNTDFVVARIGVHIGLHFNQAIFSSLSIVLNSGSPVTSWQFRCLASAAAKASGKLIR